MKTVLLAASMGLCWAPVAEANREPDALQVGFAEIDVTPDVEGAAPVWMAGYGPNRRATGIHDPLFARAVVLRQRDTKVALVSVDVIGLQYPTVQQIRAKLPGFRYVMVSSTHNHEGPDTIGLWGHSLFQSGVDPDYMALLVGRVVEVVAHADRAAVPATAAYGTATNEQLLGDSRLPKVYDAVLRSLLFARVEDGRRVGILVQWNCHPEVLGRANRLITADFPYATVAALKKRYQCPVAYFSGTVGGLMSAASNRYKDASGAPLADETFAYAEAYGQEVARLAGQALESAQPVKLSPLEVAAKPVAVPLANPYYHLARMLGVVQREGRVWTGDLERLGEPLSPQTADEQVAIETEVAYLRLGQLHVACIPGEIYPELVYGKYQEPADPAADFPDAPLETPVMKLLPGPKTLLFGLANDELGYIIPKRQWDRLPPYAYGRKTSQYGEINSCGPEVAPMIMQALENRVRALQQ